MSPTGKANPQGKGGFQGYCYRCGGWGHAAMDCATKSTDKGKGKGGGSRSKSLNSLAEAFDSEDQSTHDRTTPTQPNQMNAVSHAGYACRPGLELGGSAGPRPSDLHAVDGPEQVIDRSEESYVGAWTQMHSDRVLTAWGVRRKKRTVMFEDEAPASKPREVNSVNVSDGTWEKIDITVDSGAVDTVAPPDVASHVPIESTWASRE